MVNTSYEIMNSIGQQVMKGVLVEPTTTLNVSALASGVYIVRIGGEVVKFVKE